MAMGRILLIEPQKILQQAISLFLFPEHEVQVAEEAGSAAASFKDYDLLIIDGAALRESDRLTPEMLRVVQGCGTPTLWLEEEEWAPSPKRDKFVIVKKPLEKEALEAAVGGFLSSGPSRDRGRPPQSRGKAQASLAAATKPAAQSPEQPTFEFIDLVEVVDEAVSPKQGRKSPRKSK